MPRFTKSEMFAELREILLHQAEAIRQASNQSIAESFIGFPPLQDSSYWGPVSYEVDMGRFWMTSALSTAFDFAFSPKSIDDISLETIERIEKYLELIPRVLPNDVLGWQKFMDRDGICQSVVVACRARWNLECNDADDETVFDVQELALLANMSEGAVRNALSGQGRDGLRALDNRKPVVVERAEAKRWLRERRGFVSAFGPSLKGQASTDQLVAARSLDEIVIFLRSRIRLLAPDHQQRINEHVKGWLSAIDLDEGMAGWICQELDIDTPLFIGKLCEGISRRDGACAIYRNLIADC